LPATDLTGVGSVTLTNASQEPIKVPVDFEIRLDSPTGPVVGTGTQQPSEGFAAPGLPIKMHQAQIQMTGNPDGKKHKLYFVSDAKGAELGTFILMGITFNAK
jgi:cytochrome c